MTLANQFAPIWNSSGVNYNAIRANVTDIASSGGSTLLDLRVNDSGVFSINKSGTIAASGSLFVAGSGVFSNPVSGSSATFSSISLANNRFSIQAFGAQDVTLTAAGVTSTEPFLIGYPWHFAGFDYVPKITMQTNPPVGVKVSSDSFFAFTNSTNSKTGTIDLSLFRDAANTLGQRNSTNAQTLRLYGTYTDASNYRRLYLSSTTGGAFTLGIEGAGTGASGNTLSLATSGSNRLNITSAGNLGFNTESPAGQFDIRFLRTGVAGPDLTSGQIFSASSTYPSYVVANIFDDVLGTTDALCWGSNSINTNQWVQVQFSTSRKIGQITVYNGQPQTPNRGARRCELQGSNDGSSWTKIPAVSVANGPSIINTDEFELANNHTNKQVVQFNNSTNYLYYRIYMYTNWGNTMLGLREVEMMETGVNVADPRIFSGQNIGFGTTAPSSFIDIVPSAFDTGSPVGFTFTGAGHTTLTASTEVSDINFNLARTVQFTGGALTTQRAFRIQAPTYSFTSASTITTASTLSISGAPIAGTNATITTGYALDVESGVIRMSTAGNVGSVNVWPKIFTVNNFILGGSGGRGWKFREGQDTGYFGFGDPGGSSSFDLNFDIGSRCIFWSNGPTYQTEMSTSGVTVSPEHAIRWRSAKEVNTAPDLFIVRDAAQTLAQRNSTNAQIFRIYGTFTDASNYRRLYLSSTTAGAFTLGVEGAGTGASGNTLDIYANLGTFSTGVDVGADFSTAAPRVRFGTVNPASIGSNYGNIEFRTGSGTHPSVTYTPRLIIASDGHTRMGESIALQWRNGDPTGGTRLGFVTVSGSPSQVMQLNANGSVRVESNGGLAVRNQANSADAPITASNGTFSGHLSATTKSFLIDHPIDANKKLQYGSLESPYHGIRLTGEGVIEDGAAVIQLPAYINAFIKSEGLNVQLTPIGRNILWVDHVDLENNKIIVGGDFNGGFYWSFTGIRKDVELEVEPWA